MFHYFKNWMGITYYVHVNSNFPIEQTVNWDKNKINILIQSGVKMKDN